MRPRKISELGDAFWFKLGHGGVLVLLPIAHALEIGIKGVKECGGINKEKFGLAIKRMASEVRIAVLLR